MAQASYDVSLALSDIRLRLYEAERGIASVGQAVDTIDGNLKVVYDQVGQLARDFHEYVKKAENQHNVSLAETRLVKIRQELEAKFGYYAETRRNMLGILQANDLYIVRKETITTVTEELMISAPRYWLTPCLVALASWINDWPDIAERALREAIKRNDEKTSLLFALICRRANRKPSALKWTQRYLANQNEENLDRNCVIILDAFASGLLGTDSEGLVAKQLEEWMTRLTDKVGFIEQQTKQWSDAINLKRTTFADQYDYLCKYSKTWPKLKYVMEGAHLHANILDYFEGIFKRQSSGSALKEQIDGILSSLVTDFDDEELPIRRNEKLNQFIINYDGDMSRAQQSIQVEQSAFEIRKDFTQLLTDSAMKPEASSASVSTQKFAISLSRDWIVSAYNDIVAKNRMQVPHEIEINIENFNVMTIDGKNEEELVDEFEKMCEREGCLARAKCFDEICEVLSLVRHFFHRIRPDIRRDSWKWLYDCNIGGFWSGNDRLLLRQEKIS
jgi:hypothetical protein